MNDINPKKETIRLYAKQLRMPTLPQYETVLRQSDSQTLGYEDFLCAILARELSNRQENQQKRRIRSAGFPLMKTLDEFNFNQLEYVKEAFIQELATGDFITKHQNVIMVGNPGTGKTHLSIGLGLKACKAGFNVKFFGAAQLATQLAEAQEYHRLGRLEKSLKKADLLILDELSYLSFNRHHSELLFQILSERTERASVMITTNLEFSRWTELFEDSMMITALIDRLTFKSHILNMNGSSYRLKTG